MNNKLFILALFLAVSLAKVGSAQTIEPTLVIEPGKATFLKCEPIYISVLVINRSEADLHVRRLNMAEGFLKMTLRTSSGMAYPYRWLGFISFHDSSLSLTIPAGDTEIVVVNILPE